MSTGDGVAPGIVGSGTMIGVISAPMTCARGIALGDAVLGGVRAVVPGEPCPASASPVASRWRDAVRSRGRARRQVPLARSPHRPHAACRRCRSRRRPGPEPQRAPVWGPIDGHITRPSAPRRGRSPRESRGHRQVRPRGGRCHVEGAVLGGCAGAGQVPVSPARRALPWHPARARRPWPTESA